MYINISNGYPIKYNNIIFNEQCYYIESKPINFFLNREKNIKNEILEESDE